MESMATVTRKDMQAKIEPFDSFWEAPEDVERGFSTFAQFYRANYLEFVPDDRNAKLLVVSCGPGYFVNLLLEEGYSRVLGIDSDPAKLEYALARELPCIEKRAFDFLRRTSESYDLIFVEQELNHLTKAEILEFLALCRGRLHSGGKLIVHVINGANPITGAESLAQNFDHFNTFTEYSLRQVLGHSGFQNVVVIPLHLYVFYRNPLNYVGAVLTGGLTLAFRLMFKLYGKRNKLFTKKIGAIATK